MSDLISRQAAIDALARTAREKFNLSDEFNHYLAGLLDGEVAIRQLPSAQPKQQWIPVNEMLPKQRPHGQWELHEDDSWSGGGFTKCSACGYGFAWGASFEAEEWEFCPICGASMDLKGEPHEQN